jgi:thiol-disulfide isomerase/thioredoxin
MSTPIKATRGRLAVRLLSLVFALVGAVAWAHPGSAVAAEPPFPVHAPWLNVERPLTAEDLRGHVVLLDFFTPGCINCIHVLPETAKLEREFGSRLLVIGVNSPKFTASEETGNLVGFIQRYDIQHPIITDTGMVLWTHYGVFAWPTQVLLGPNGGVVGQYVGEGKYAAIRRDLIETLASAREAGTLKDTSLPVQAMAHDPNGLLQPGKVAVSAHYVAVSDTGHNRVVLLDHFGKVLKVVGDGVRGSRDGAPGQAEFDGPQGLAFDGDLLYVADTGNALIRAITLPSGEVKTVAGNGEQGYGVEGRHPARKVGLSSPWGLQLVGRQLYIAMAGVHQIWRLDLDEGRVGPFAGSGAEGIADGPLGEASFAQSSALAYHDGGLYVADPEASAVRRINLKTDEVKTLIGKGLFVFGLRNGEAADALLQHDQGLASLDHRLYIADTFNNAVRTLDLGTNQVSTLATGLSQPGGLAVLDKGTLLVADTNADRVVTIGVGTGRVRLWPVKGL